MKAMILSAGRGERMRPLTDHCPKPLIKVKNSALIEYHILALKKAGIKEIVINHAWLGKQIEEYLGDGRRWNIQIHYSAEKKPLETAGGIIKALPILTSESNHFIVVNGDVFTDYDFTALVNLNTQSLAHLLMIKNPEHHLQGDFYLNNGMLSSDTNSEDNTQEKFTYSGIGLFHVDLFKGLSIEKRALAPILINAMKKTQVSGEVYSGLWSDVGTIERLKKLEKMLS